MTMKINGLAFVGTPVTDMKRARSFYEDVLGLEVSEEMMSGKWVEYYLGNNTLAIASPDQDSQWRAYYSQGNIRPTFRSSFLLTP